MQKSIVIGGGCFWCLEAVFDRLVGVTSVKSGFAGGKDANPSYKEVCYGNTGHAEVIKIDYNSDEIDLATLLEVFFTIHNPTTLNRQGNDVGTQYRSIIFYESDEEKEIVANFIETEGSQIWDNPIVTEVTASETFYPAEAYHNDYYKLNGSQSYCQFVITPKVEKLKAKYSKLLKQ